MRRRLSKQVPIYAGGGGVQDASIAVDGGALSATPTNSPPAVVTFEGSGIQSGSQRLLNSLWGNGRMVTLIGQDYANYATATIPIPPGFLQPGSNVVRVRAGDSVSPTDLAANHDDFTIRNVRLILPDDTALTDPAVPPTKVVSLGDGFPGGNATEQQVTADFTMTATAAQVEGVTADLDTTRLADGPHTITATGTKTDGSVSRVSAQVISDNTPPQVTITSPVQDENHEGVDLHVTAQAADATSTVVSVTGTLDGTAIPVPDTFPSDNIVPGRHTLTVTAVDGSGNRATTTRTFSTSVGKIPVDHYDRGQVAGAPYAGPTGPTLVAAGDVSCDANGKPTPTTCQQAGTAEVARSLDPDVVATLGDEQYDVGPSTTSRTPTTRPGAGSRPSPTRSSATTSTPRPTTPARRPADTSTHDHNYQRYAPQKSDGTADAAYGLREFVVGTGGDSHFPLSNAGRVTNLQTGSTDTFGVLDMRLSPDHYTWKFVPEPGNGNGTYTDAGTGTCHGAPKS